MSSPSRVLAASASPRLGRVRCRPHAGHCWIRPRREDRLRRHAAGYCGRKPRVCRARSRGMLSFACLAHCFLCVGVLGVLQDPHRAGVAADVCAGAGARNATRIPSTAHVAGVDLCAGGVLPPSLARSCRAHSLRRSLAQSPSRESSLLAPYPLSLGL